MVPIQALLLKIFENEPLNVLYLLLVNLLGWHDSRKAEVTNFDPALGVYQKILRLKVPVDHIGRVNEIECAELVVQEGDDVLLRDLRLRNRIHQFVKVCVHYFHYDEKVGQLPKVYLKLVIVRRIRI